MEDPRLASGSHAKLGNGMESPYFVAAPGALGTDLGDITGELEEAPSHPDSPSVEDYDEVSRNPVGDGGRAPAELSLQHRTTDRNDEDVSANTSPRLVIPLDTKDLPAMQDPRGFLLAADDNELREILRRGLLKAQEPASAKKRARFAEMLFTRKFSAFDRQNGVGAASPFHGFFTLFWITVFFFMVKIAADNWRNTGNILGTNDIMKTMFRRDIFVLAVSDGVMCGLTGVSWLFQSLVFQGYFTWDRSGWILQNLWQTTYFAGVIGWTQLRDWPWSHTVFFVMHGIVMLMKQHSYAFYNGYLSSAHKKRRDLLIKLKQLEQMAPVRSPSRTEPPASAISTSHLAHPPSLADMKQRRMSNSGREQPSDLDRIAVAINSGAPLDLDQVDIFERIVKWEIDGLTEELRGKSTRLERAYPHNLTAANHYEYIFLPTVVYELEYPRSEKINWSYVAEKVAACFGVIFVMIMISQAFICKRPTFSGPRASMPDLASRSGCNGNRADEGGRDAAGRSFSSLPLDDGRPDIPFHDGVSCRWRPFLRRIAQALTRALV